MSEIRELTRELVEIPSHEDEGEAGNYLETWLREETTATVERDDHSNVIAHQGSGEPTLALVGHHDVVPPDKSQIDTTASGSYAVEERDGRLYGRGTADMKGALAAALCAFRDATVADGALLFASFVGEETGGAGARGAIEDGFSPTYAIVGEGSTGYAAPGVTDVAIAHKGRRASTLTADGTAAHASEPEKGTNAIYRATDAIDTVRTLSAPEATVQGQQVQGSLVVTEIAGGSAWNVIPEECSVTIDERTVPGDRADLEGVAELPGISHTVDQDLPPMACDDPAFVEEVVGAARGAHPEGQEPQRVIKPHATDAGWLSQAGVECVVCGPAEPGEAHTDSESVSIAVLERCSKIYRSVADRLLSEP